MPAPNGRTSYRRQVKARLQADAFPKLGALPLREVTSADVLACLGTVSARSAVQAKLLRTWIGGVFRYGCARLLCEFDPTWPLRRTVRTPQVRHHPAIPAGRLGAFLRAVASIPATSSIRTALRLLLLTAVRANELCAARWELCLAHGERDQIKAAYDHAERLPARAALMQAWADHLDRTKAGADVILINRAA